MILFFTLFLLDVFHCRTRPRWCSWHFLAASYAILLIVPITTTNSTLLPVTQFCCSNSLSPCACGFFAEFIRRLRPTRGNPRREGGEVPLAGEPVCPEVGVLAQRAHQHLGHLYHRGTGARPRGGVPGHRRRTPHSGKQVASVISPVNAFKRLEGTLICM